MPQPSELDRRSFLKQAAGSAAAIAIVPSALGAVTAWTRRDSLRVGVIGAGRQGRAALGELSKLAGVTIAAVCETDDRRLRSGLRRASGATGYASITEMLDANAIDAAVIATPTHTHRAVAERLFDANKHVYCECPLAHTREDCSAIAQAARASGVVAAGGFQGRSNPVYQLARGFFKSDSVRDPVAFRAQNNEKTSWISPAREPDRYKAFNWKLDPELSLGLPGELGAQQFDVFHWYTGRYPARVSGYGAVRAWRDDRKVADTVALTLGFEDGTALQYGASLGNSYEGTAEYFYGTNAAIKLSWSHGWMFKESDAPTQGWEVYANRQQFHNDEGITLIAGATQLAEQGKLKDGVGLPYTSLYYALADWISAIDQGGTPACTIDEAARATAVGIAANQAVVSGESIAIDLSAL